MNEKIKQLWEMATQIEEFYVCGIPSAERDLDVAARAIRRAIYYIEEEKTATDIKRRQATANKPTR